MLFPSLICLGLTSPPVPGEIILVSYLLQLQTRAQTNLKPNKFAKENSDEKQMFKAEDKGCREMHMPVCEALE